MENHLQKYVHLIKVSRLALIAFILLEVLFIYFSEILFSELLIKLSWIGVLTISSYFLMNNPFGVLFLLILMIISLNLFLVFNDLEFFLDHLIISCTEVLGMLYLIRKINKQEVVLDDSETQIV
ncbi:hypothetical protein [Flammeovirga pacifica]|uniref:Uncharacterized protein n=1 Tax=Flammeovirga pacifica TaxID=915059 RepID=A0A1S1Z4G3_FLAPC|nr:hypothetical protein [Flammeovirga pacifica]OHX68179.1 hypothetical protein NH26_18410 [Flammeovirga pacifica]